MTAHNDRLVKQKGWQIKILTIEQINPQDNHAIEKLLCSYGNGLNHGTKKKQIWKETDYKTTQIFIKCAQMF